MQGNIVRYPLPLVLAALTSVLILPLLRIRPTEAQVVLEQALPLTMADTSASLQSDPSAREEDPSTRESAKATGIREVIPTKYMKRYASWKSEFLSTETGRSQWEEYANHKDFTLTITISTNNESDGKTSQFKWDHSGRLIAATITLGSRIDEG